jgi:predicted alpha/beta superfamily hydrolase
MKSAPNMTGEFRTYSGFPSQHLKVDHDVIVHLPPGYFEDRRRYSVLYLQDGQNLFDPATAFGGQDWRVDETADALIRNEEVEPLILVGVYNAGNARIDEYTASRDRASGKGGLAHLYGRMLVEELKPFIDSEYRTLQDAPHTGVGGSSLGGLVSLTTGLHYPGVFGKLAVMSPSVWWDHRAILHTVASSTLGVRPRIWLDIGTAEGESTTADARLLRDTLTSKGWREGIDLAYFEADGAEHNERAWGDRAGPMLRFLYPNRPA